MAARCPIPLAHLTRTWPSSAGIPSTSAVCSAGPDLPGAILHSPTVDQVFEKQRIWLIGVLRVRLRHLIVGGRLGVPLHPGPVRLPERRARLERCQPGLYPPAVTIGGGGQERPIGALAAHL